MPILRWHKGLKKATTAERFLILEGEHIARQLAITLEYEERLEALNAVLVDADDIAVRAVNTKWARYAGCLYLHYVVHYRSAGRVRTFRWRKTMPKARRRRLGDRVNAFTA